MMLKSSRGDLNGFLDEGSHIKGELHFEDTFKVSGKVSGSVISQEGDLELYELGEIEGEVRVRQALISGKVRGEIRAERVEITSTGKVGADVHTPSLILREGAFFEGRCFMKTASRSDEPGHDNVARMPLAKKR